MFGMDEQIKEDIENEAIPKLSNIKKTFPVIRIVDSGVNIHHESFHDKDIPDVIDGDEWNGGRLNVPYKRCPNLQLLSIKCCPRATDASMAQIAYRCRNLKQLDISYCYEIWHEFLELIGRNCPNLKILKQNLVNWLDPSQHVVVVPADYLNACQQDGDTKAAVTGKFMPQLGHLEIIS
ncbi:hypothetical protein V6N13_010498 [Hibiscus sabdariffa]